MSAVNIPSRVGKAQSITGVAVTRRAESQTAESIHSAKPSVNSGAAAADDFLQTASADCPPSHAALNSV